MFSRSRRNWIAVVFITLMAFGSGYYSFFLRPDHVLVQDDGVAKWMDRMQLVREHLPDTVREMGYVTVSESNPFSLEYHLTKYALVPVVVRRGDEFDWLLVNANAQEAYGVLEKYVANGYEVEKIGSSLFLLHKTIP